MSYTNHDVAVLLAEARKQERELCAKIAEEIADINGDGELYIARKIADKIRSSASVA